MPHTPPDQLDGLAQNGLFPQLVAIGNVSQDNLRAGLAALRDKVAKDHKLSNWFNHPMPGFAEYTNKVWEWDFKPTGERSHTRPGWRLLAFVPSPTGPEPILARPFICWDKGEAPKKNQEKFIAEALKKFLSEHVQVTTEEETFNRIVNNQGMYIAVCQRCWDHVEAPTLDELDILEATHKDECPGGPPT